MVASEQVGRMATYHIDLEPDPRDGSVTATIREFPGCIAEGDDREKALLSLLAVAPCWIDAAHASEFSIPEPDESDESNMDPFSADDERIARRIAVRDGDVALYRRAFLEADIGTLEKMIADRSGDPDYSRHGLEQRLARVKEELAALP